MKERDPNLCNKIIRTGSFSQYSHQCPRKPWKDGWCKQHHPEEKRRRDDERQAEWSKKYHADLELSKRKMACVRACAGIPDPARTIPKLVEVADLLTSAAGPTFVSDCNVAVAKARAALKEIDR